MSVPSHIVSRHRLNEEDHTAILPRILPETVEELAAQEREPQRAAGRRSRRPVVVVAAATVVLSTAATGWALARPAAQAPVPPVSLATVGGESYADGFGEASPTPDTQAWTPPRDPGPRPSSPAPLPSASATGSPALAPSPSAATLEAGGRRSLRAAWSPDRYVRQSNGDAALVSVTTGSSGEVRLAATFTVVAGLADAKCFSFAGSDGGYLRHRDYRIHHDRSDGSRLFREDATFCVRQGGLPGSVYLESYNYRGYYVHLRGDELWIDRWRDRDDFRRDCSFVVTSPWG
ncbi:hypothetical protein CS0771_27640 [Catellatospora sp. IY07-71]|nr:hypothetical protein CS0771_27640 [Catellatospora sp. IY07-71]